jgi:hypothetical protein
VLRHLFPEQVKLGIEVETYFAKCKAVDIDREKAADILARATRDVAQRLDQIKATDLAWQRIVEGSATV